MVLSYKKNALHIFGEGVYPTYWNCVAISNTSGQGPFATAHLKALTQPFFEFLINYKLGIRRWHKFKILVQSFFGGDVVVVHGVSYIYF